MEIFELSQRLSDPVQVGNDMRDAMGLVTGMLRDRYVSRMKEALTAMHERSRAEPPKEVTLLRSLKPFMREDAHSNIDKMTEMLLLADALTKLREAKSEVVNTKNEEAVHEDGVYEIDWECMKEKKDIY